MSGIQFFDQDGNPVKAELVAGPIDAGAWIRKPRWYIRWIPGIEWRYRKDRRRAYKWLNAIAEQNKRMGL